ncbi:MAG: flippase-like domain-containing protein [Anaerolineales bacterium]|nr:flippase-like domain-containing protein [Anaerolineales bacterium]
MRKKIISILQLLSSLIFLTWLINLVGVNTIIDTLRSVDLNWFLPALLLFQINMVIRTVRWQILARALNDRSSFLELVYLYYLGFFFNNFIPSGFGGDIVKVIGLQRQDGRGPEALSSVVMDRIIGILGTTLIALGTIAGLSLGRDLNQLDLPPLLFILILGFSISIPAGMLYLRLAEPLNWLASTFPWMRPVVGHAKLQRLVQTVREYPLNALVKSLLTSLPFTIILTIIQYCIARSLSVEAPWYIFALFVPIISIATLLPISFNGLGTREGIYLLLFGPIGILPEKAVSMSLAFYIIRICTGLIGGLFFLIRSLAKIIAVPKRNVV